ncbi:YunG family protein [Janthinobacterium sp. HLX7-2]|uniref:YunG family protein n=1 Tax=Janthinobacterium sp. HLX7-2 TaxID=1259331 RepID=UPI003F205A42
MIFASKTFATPLELYRSISRVWSGDTSSPTDAWSQSNPAQNHCSITSLVVQDYFGGEILITETSGGTHFYNLIDGKKWDLTVRQFAEPVPYDDTPSSRDAALADTSEQKYALLTTRLKPRRYTQFLALARSRNFPIVFAAT